MVQMFGLKEMKKIYYLKYTFQDVQILVEYMKLVQLDLLVNQKELMMLQESALN